jgi:hypothetical protein
MRVIAERTSRSHSPHWPDLFSRRNGLVRGRDIVGGGRRRTPLQLVDCSTSLRDGIADDILDNVGRPSTNRGDRATGCDLRRNVVLVLLKVYERS